MNLDDFADATPDVLEKMDDATLLAHFKQYFPLTRPEMAARPKGGATMKPVVQLSPQKQAALAALAATGVDVSFMRKKFK